MKRLGYSFLILHLFLLPFSSCKKGCTNAGALNYSASAKEDDASCLFCDSIFVSTETGVTEWSDRDSLSPLINQVVMRSEVVTSIYHYSGNGCRQLGMKTACSDSAPIKNFGYATVSLKNLWADTLIVSGELYIHVSLRASTAHIYLSDFHIPPFATVTLPQPYYLSCLASDFVQPYLNVYSDVSFKYK